MVKIGRRSDAEKAAAKQRRAQRKADRKMRRAERLANRAVELDSTLDERAEIMGKNERGERVVQEVKIRKEGSKRRNRRLAEAEEQIDELQEEVETLEDELEALRETVDSILEQQEKQRTSGLVFSEAAHAAAQTLLTIVNTGDKVHNQPAAMIAALLRGAERSGQLDDTQAGWLRLGETVAQIAAFWDPAEGMSSVFQGDKAGGPNGGELVELAEVFREGFREVAARLEKLETVVVAA